MKMQMQYSEINVLELLHAEKSRKHYKGNEAHSDINESYGVLLQQSNYIHKDMTV